MKHITLSVIMPAFNEEGNIVDSICRTLRAFKDFNINGEIIVINDGSTDKTEDLVNQESKKDDRINLVNHDSNKGIGGSFWDGVDHAKGDFVVMIPGDGENDPWEIFRYYTLLDHVDIVIPFAYNREVRPLFRNFLSFVYRFIINTTFLVNFNYTNGTVLYRKSILKEIDYRSNGFFFQTDILIRSVKNGYLFAEVPYKLCTRNSGRSKAISYPALKNVISGYIRLVRGIHFSKNKINIKTKETFSKDSLTAKRYS